MGSTTIAMLRTGNKLAMAHIGDSRAYLLRDGKFSARSPRTTPSSSSSSTSAGSRPEEAEDHPQRSLVTRVMTGQPDDEPDLSLRELRAGDRYLLCSDGLSDFVRRDVIEEILREAPNPTRPPTGCIEVALKASARDNVTVIVADVVDLPTPRLPTTVPADRRRRVAARPRGQAHPRACRPVRPRRPPAWPARSRAPSADDDDRPACSPRSRARSAVIWLRRVVLAFALAADPRPAAGMRRRPGPRTSTSSKPSDGLRRHLAGRRPEHRPGQPVPRLPASDVPVAELPTYVQDVVSTGTPLGSLADANTRVETLRTSATRLPRPGRPRASRAARTRVVHAVAVDHDEHDAVPRVAARDTGDARRSPRLDDGLDAVRTTVETITPRTRRGVELLLTVFADRHHAARLGQRRPRRSGPSRPTLPIGGGLLALALAVPPRAPLAAAYADPVLLPIATRAQRARASS